MMSAAMLLLPALEGVDRDGGDDEHQVEHGQGHQQPIEGKPSELK